MTNSSNIAKHEDYPDNFFLLLHKNILKLLQQASSKEY